MITPRPINDAERAALECFADAKISLEDLLQQTRGMLVIEFGSSERRLISHFTADEPGVVLNLSRVETALQQLRRQAYADRSVIEWATMLLLNNQYVWDASSEEGEIIADTLHRLSVPGI